MKPTHQNKSKVDELRDALKSKTSVKDAPKKQPSPATPEDVLPEPAEGQTAEERQYSDIESQIRAAEEEAKSHYDKLLRVMAEFENFKKRIQKEKDEHLQYSNERLLGDLLPVLDDFDRVLEHMPEATSPEIQALEDGISLVRKNMMAVLQKYGLTEVGGLGKPFNPAVHEAISTAPSENSAPDTIIAVHRKGYKLFERLLRPAMVTVAK